MLDQFEFLGIRAGPRPEAVRAFLALHAQQQSGLTRREAAKHLGQPDGVVQNA